MRFWVLVFVLSVGLEAWHSLPYPTPGVLAAADPSQTALTSGDPTGWNEGDVKFTPLAHYIIKARILSRESYFFDHMSGISSLDLALGWGRMSDPAIYDKLNIRQFARWYEYHWPDQPPIPPDEIIRSSANTHIIPANLAITNQLFWLRQGDVVQLSGYLVQANFPNGGTWTSSLSRTDTGNHSCEVMWVNSVKCIAR
jgi:hypothetical protein